MRKNYGKLIAAGMFILVFTAGCGLNNETVSENAGDSGYHAREQENQNDGKPEQSEESKNDAKPKQSGDSKKDTKPKQSGDSKKDTKPKQPRDSQSNQSQPQATAAAEDIEKELAAYRAEREQLKQPSTIDNCDIVQMPNEENYKYGIGIADETAVFDTRELTLAFEAAEDYVTGTLKLKSEVYSCIDPRMNAIYEDEDKGVANGYDADNIFLCEYNDNGKWLYLILVREKKGTDWNVLYHGSSYKTDKHDGGDKK